MEEVVMTEIQEQSPKKERKVKTNGKTRKTVHKVVMYIVNALLGIIFLFPLIFLFVSAFNPARDLPSQIGSFGDLMPEYLTFSNFASVFTRIPMLQYFGNTLLYALGTVFGVLVVNSMAGYALAKINFKGNKLVYNFIVSVAAGIAAILLVEAGIGDHSDQIMIGGVMLLIPGIAMTNAIRDMLIGDIASGLLRLMNSVLVAVAIACGFAFSIVALGGVLWQFN